MAVAPDSRTLPELVLEQAGRDPEQAAVTSPLGDRSYGELAARAAAVRAALRGLGVGKDDTVALLAPNRPEWIDAAFGILGTAARVAAFNTWVKAWDLEYLLSHSSASVLVMADRVGSNDLLGELRTLLPEAWERPVGAWRSSRFPSLRHLIVLGADVPPGATSWDDLLASAVAEAAPAAPCEPDAVAFILYTSGSSEYPKAVPLVHRSLIENGFNIGERAGLTTDDRVWLASPLFWSFGAANALMATLTHGAGLVLQPGFEPEGAAELIERHRCTAAYLLPTIADALVHSVGDRIRDAGTLRKGVMIGRPDEVLQVAEQLGVSDVCNVYGSTETYGNCCVTPHTMPLERRATCQGPPLPGVELRIVDPEDRRPRATGDVGEIEVRGHITPGYLGGDGGSDSAFADGWFRTGDLGTLDDDGNLAFVGRSTEMIKSSGINVSPAEVERFIAGHPEVSEVVVVGAPHHVKGEVAVAFVRLQPRSTLSSEDVVAFCKGRIAGYKIPAAVVVQDAIPRTVTGKISRRALRTAAAATVAAGRR